MNIDTGRQPNGQTYKVCPTCRQPAVLAIEVCRRCGFRYPPQQFAPSPSYSQRSASKADFGPARQSQQTVALVCVGVLLSLVLAGGLILASSSRRHQKPLRGAAIGGGLMSATGIPSDQVDQRLLTAGANRSGDLEVSLAWNSYTDLDLQVAEPSGDRVDARNTHSRGGGEQDVDMNPTLLTPEGSLMAEREQPPGAAAVIPLTPQALEASQQLAGIEELMRQSGLAGNRAPSRFSSTPSSISSTRAPRPAPTP